MYDEVPSISDEGEILSTTSDFYNIGPNILLHWQQRLKATASEDSSPHSDESSENENNEDSNEHQLLSESTENANSLFSITDHEQQGLASTILDQISRVSPDSIRTSVTWLIQETLFLNHKQFLIARIILNHVI